MGLRCRGMGRVKPNNRSGYHLKEGWEIGEYNPSHIIHNPMTQSIKNKIITPIQPPVNRIIASGMTYFFPEKGDGLKVKLQGSGVLPAVSSINSCNPNFNAALKL
jgi:hypothetical protein